MKINPFLLIHFILLLTFISVPVSSLIPFCYINCDTCTSALSDKCSTCSTYFKLAGASPNSCVFDTSLTDVKLSKSTTDFSVSPNPTSSCALTYPVLGDYGNNAAITISTLSAIP